MEAVWKAVEALRRDGYQITSAPNRGYRLAGGP
ncbi:HTH domain-containing protein, partial [Intestinimonas massiliensis]